MPPDEAPASTAVPPPTFDTLKLSSELRRAVDELGYTHPTPVQRAVFDPVTRGADLVVQARTGTGKTAAYGLPMIDSVVRRSSAVVQVLVLCPTRELALQVAREMEALAKYRGTKVAAVYGGAPMGSQVQKINEGAQLVAGTPGRVLDHLRRGTLDPKSLRAVVLDESDEMLSMGFLPQIDEILSFLPASRQTLLFSATLPPEIQRLAETRLRNPEFITLSGDHIGALEISHFVYISRGDKASDLLQLLEVENPESAIVFCNTKESTKRVASALQQQGFDAEWLNADLGQSDREKVMEATRLGKLRFLVATDVAARGIDISHLTHVINYDFPESCEQYVHRTGRTGRAGRTGTALSLIEASDIGNLYMLRLTYKIRPVERQLPTSHDLKTRAEADLVQMFADLFAKRPVHPDDLALARRIQTHEAADRIIAGIVRDHLGARPAAGEQAAAARRAAAPRSVKGFTGPSAPRGAPPKAPRFADPKPPAPAPTPVPKVEAEAAASSAPQDNAPPAGSSEPATPPKPRREHRQRAEVEGPTVPPVPRRGESARRGDRPERAADGEAPRDRPRLERAERAERTADGDAPRDRPRAERTADGDVPRDRPRAERTADGDVPRDRPRLERTERTADGNTPRDRPRLERREPRPDPDVSLVKSEPQGELHESSDGNGRPPRNPNAVELFVSVGRKDGARASDFYTVLEQRAGITIDDTDYVNVRQRHTFIGLSKDLLARALEALNGATIAGREATAEPSRSSQ